MPGKQSPEVRLIIKAQPSLNKREHGVALQADRSTRTERVANAPLKELREIQQFLRLPTTELSRQHKDKIEDFLSRLEKTQFPDSFYKALPNAGINETELVDNLARKVGEWKDRSRLPKEERGKTVRLKKQEAAKEKEASFTLLNQETHTFSVGDTLYIQTSPKGTIEQKIIVDVNKQEGFVQTGDGKTYYPGVNVVFPTKEAAEAYIQGKKGGVSEEMPEESAPTDTVEQQTPVESVEYPPELADDNVRRAVNSFDSDWYGDLTAEQLGKLVSIDRNTLFDYVQKKKEDFQYIIDNHSELGPEFVQSGEKLERFCTSKIVALAKAALEKKQTQSEEPAPVPKKSETEVVESNEQKDVDEIPEATETPENSEPKIESPLNDKVVQGYVDDHRTPAETSNQETESTPRSVLPISEKQETPTSTSESPSNQQYESSTPFNEVGDENLQRLLQGKSAEDLQNFLHSEAFVSLEDDEKVEKLAYWFHEERVKQALTIDEFEEKGGFESEDKRKAYEAWDWEMAEKLLKSWQAQRQESGEQSESIDSQERSEERQENGETKKEQDPGQVPHGGEEEDYTEGGWRELRDEDEGRAKRLYDAEDHGDDLVDSGVRVEQGASEKSTPDNYRFQLNMSYLNNPTNEALLAKLKKTIGAEGEKEYEMLQRFAKYAEGEVNEGQLQQLVEQYLNDVVFVKDGQRQKATVDTTRDIYARLQHETGLDKDDLGEILDQQESFLRAKVQSDYLREKKFGLGAKTRSVLKTSGYVGAGVAGMLTGGVAIPIGTAVAYVAERGWGARQVGQRLSVLKDRLRSVGTEEKPQDRALFIQLKNNVTAAIATRIQETIDRVGGKAQADEGDDKRIRDYVAANENLKELNTEQKESLAVLAGVLQDHDRKNDALQRKRGGILSNKLNNFVDGFKKVIRSDNQNAATAAAFTAIGLGVRRALGAAGLGVGLGVGGVHAADYLFEKLGGEKRTVTADEVHSALRDSADFNEVIAIAEEQLQDKKFRKKSPQAYDALRLAVDKRRQELLTANKEKFTEKNEQGVEKNVDAVVAYMQEYNDRTAKKITIRKGQERTRALARTAGALVGGFMVPYGLSYFDGKDVAPGGEQQPGAGNSQQPEGGPAQPATKEFTLTIPAEQLETPGAPEVGPQFEHYAVERTWMDNDTSDAMEGNEKLFKFGGIERTGFDADGKVVYDISQMTEGGSFHNEKQLNVPELMKKGELVMLVTPHDGAEAIPVPVQPDGTVVVPDELRAWWDDSGPGGSASFQGKHLEIARVDEAAAAGVPRPADIVATVKGTNELEQGVLEEMVKPEEAAPAATTQETQAKELQFAISNEDISVSAEEFESARVSSIEVPADHALPEGMHLAAIDTNADNTPEGFALVAEHGGTAVTVAAWEGGEPGDAIAHAQATLKHFENNGITAPADMRAVMDLEKVTGLSMAEVADNYNYINREVLSDDMKAAVLRVLAGGEAPADVLKAVDPEWNTVTEIKTGSANTLIFKYSPDKYVTLLTDRMVLTDHDNASASGAVKMLDSVQPSQLVSALKNPDEFFGVAQVPAAADVSAEAGVSGEDGIEKNERSAGGESTQNEVSSNETVTTIEQQQALVRNTVSDIDSNDFNNALTEKQEAQLMQELPAMSKEMFGDFVDTTNSKQSALMRLMINPENSDAREGLLYEQVSGVLQSRLEAVEDIAKITRNGDRFLDIAYQGEDGGVEHIYVGQGGVGNSLEKLEPYSTKNLNRYLHAIPVVEESNIAA
jgi:hypothetical protein